LVNTKNIVWTINLKGEKVMENTKCNRGKCPKCGSENLEWGNTEIDGEGLGYEFECNDCGCQGTEWYNLTYVETIVKTE
jgi:predicted nucleic-acid-binding Zn-ribbon protein